MLLQTALAMCTVLSTTLTRVPNGVLRSKFVGSVQLLSKLVEAHREQVRWRSVGAGTRIQAVAVLLVAFSVSYCLTRLQQQHQQHAPATEPCSSYW